MGEITDEQINALFEKLWPKFEERFLAKANAQQQGVDLTALTLTLSALSGELKLLVEDPAKTSAEAAVEAAQKAGTELQNAKENEGYLKGVELGVSDINADKLQTITHLDNRNMFQKMGQGMASGFNTAKAKISDSWQNNGDKWAAGLSTATGMINSFIASNLKTANESDVQSLSTRASMRQAAANSGNKYAAAAAAVDGMIDAAGGYTQASQTGHAGTDVGNKAASMLLPGAGFIAKDTHDYSMSDELKASSAYGGTKALGETAEANLGKMLFKRKVNKLIDEANELQNIFAQIDEQAKEDRLAQASNYDATLYLNQLALQGGIDTALLRAAKQGGVLEPFEELLIPFDFDINSIMKFQDGGQMSIIPEGALHAHRHHMEDDEHITKKGIPVVDNNGKQQAEIERNEWVWNYDLSKKVEELWLNYKDAKEKGGHYNKFAIEAGKMIVSDLFKNTDDRTGLIKETK